MEEIGKEVREWGPKVSKEAYNPIPKIREKVPTIF